MTNSQRLASVRRCLELWLDSQQCDTDAEIRDSVLIRDGFYVGRRFQLGNFSAVWFMEQDEVKVRDASGSVVARFDAQAIDQASQSPIKSDPTSDDATIISIPMVSEPLRHHAEVRRAA